jgi:hypothetical protein
MEKMTEKKAFRRLSGAKFWWNKLCKKKYRFYGTADEFKYLYLENVLNFGTFEMPSYCAKDGCPHLY